MKTFALKIEEVLKDKNINTVQLAEKLGVSQSLVSQWLSGEKRTRKFLKPLADFSGRPIEYFLDDNIETVEQLKSEIKDDNDTVYVPFFKDGVVSAGFGAENDDLGEPDLLPFKPEDLRIMFNVSPKAKIGIIPCFGNSMEPTIMESDLVVFCHDGQEAIEGAIYVCRYDNELLVKRFKKRPYFALISDNRDYEPIKIEELLTVEIIGRVVGSYSINSKRF
ncbi:LexA family transcriptional regulator [Campylobacter sp. RM6883]|uniref:XRE family transcriptional regulator n=1 Tax=Campylobacter californiensis TaxID=1032243 RepID=UPI0014520363|nr:LexA family transcriptional regulator [Campylobacter sp. RM6914]MBE2985337.1 LexA family transcriptional regulator [Campylobacter sp. RM6883]MBE2995870.1 LexA family transcriptional regulator [Campylobacter sp. RM6913]QCD51240.1 peptidase S24 LexA-like protein [Campylobacter sp. RM6914]